MEDFDGVKAVVTGGAGFIGLHIVDWLMSMEAQVCVLDDLGNACISNLRKWEDEPKFELVKADIRNREAVRPALGPVW